MKLINKIYAIALLALVSIAAACDKKDELPFYENGTAVVLTASASAVAPAPADSNNTSLKLTWTSPNYKTDEATVKYIIEVDSAGRNFSKAVSKTVTGKLEYAFVAKELNAILLGFGFNFNVAYDINVRVTSSYGNNNEQYKSNVLTIKATPYKIPPKVALPGSGKLFIVGDASQGGWNNPVPVPTQELSRIDETTFGGIFQLNGGKEYLILPVNGSWDNKYAIANKGAAGASAAGDFFASNGPGDNFPAPANNGLYKIILDFQTGKYNVTEFTQQHGLPANLFIVGGATPGGWNNPVPVPSQQLTRVNSTQWQLTLALKKNEKYLFLPENGNWGKKFGVEDDAVPGVKLAGKLAPEGKDIPAPDEDASYKIVFDLVNNTYKLTKQ
ncbi:MAG: SusE domain-containing protein [Flavihumibacter sp.]|nr:SusE domain-containing protein [Flavihumibacter sp.]